MKEEVILLGAARSLVGVVTLPDSGVERAGAPWVLLLNAGLIHKAGPHRLHVKLARRLAERGFPVLRFDFSGVGDSPPRADSMPTDRAAPLEVAEAMNTLAERFGAASFVPMGICSGAARAFQVAAADPRVAGAVLINAQARDVGGELDAYMASRRDDFYFWNVAFFNPRSWWRALTGRVDYGAAARHLAGALMKPFRGRSRRFDIEGWDITGDLRKIASRAIPLILVYSRGDPGAILLDAVAGAEVKNLEKAGLVSVAVIPDADHIFTPLGSQEQLGAILDDWLDERFPAAAAAERSGA